MLAKIKATLLWVYNWITVLAAVVLGPIAILPPVLDVFAANLPAVLPSAQAAVALATIGILKGICAIIQGLYAVIKARKGDDA